MSPKTNKVLIVVILVLVAIIIWLIVEKKEEGYVDKNLILPGQIETNNTADPIIESIPDGWLKSPTFGFYYPQEMNIIEYYSDTSAVPMDPQALTADAIPTFRGTMPPDHDMVISWGDHWGNPPAWSACTPDQFGPFVPGVSAFTCLKGYRTWVAHTSARNAVSSEDLKIFSDFVIKNQ